MANRFLMRICRVSLSFFSKSWLAQIRYRTCGYRDQKNAENGIFFLRPTRFTQRDAFVAALGPFSAPLAYTCIRLCRAHSQRDPFVVVLGPLCTTCRRKAKKRTLYLRSVVFNLRSKRPPLVFLPEKTGEPARKTKRKTASQKGQTVRAGGRSSFGLRFEVFLIFFLKERACRNPLSDVWLS